MTPSFCLYHCVFSVDETKYENGVKLTTSHVYTCIQARSDFSILRLIFLWMAFVFICYSKALYWLSLQCPFVY